nr:TolC family protein [Clostridium aestuarii]
MQKELEVNNVKWERNNKQDELVADVKKLYYEILVKNEVINVQKSKITRVSKQLKDVKRQIELGTMSKNILINYELDLDKAQNELKKIQHEQESLMMDLNMKSGNDVNNKLVLKEEEIPEVKLNVNLPNIIKDLQKNSYEVKSLEKQIRIKVQEKNIVDLNADDDVPIEGIKYKDDVVEDLKDEIIQLEYDIEDKKTDLEFKARNDYNNILKIKDDMESKKLDYDKNLKLLDAAKTKYQIGLTTDKEYKAAEEECKKALCAYKQSEIDYYIAAEKFKDFIQ